MANYSVDFKNYSEKEKRIENKCFCVTSKEGYAFTNGMIYSSLEIQTSTGQVVCRISSKDSVKNLYKQFIQNIGTYSKATQNNFLNNKYCDLKSGKECHFNITAEKFTVFKSLPPDEKKIRSCRLSEDFCVEVNKQKYYPSVNLNISEFLHSISIRIPYKEKANFIIIAKDGIIPEQPETESDIENSTITPEIISKIKNTPYFSINLVNESVNTLIKEKKKEQGNNSNRKSSHYSIDFDELNKKKNTIGKLGELLVCEYIRKELGYSAEIVSEDTKLGYDIVYTDNHGKTFFVEVKTTKHSEADRFFISANEKAVASKNKERYKLFRVFNLNCTEQTADLKIYNNITEDKSLVFNPVSYFVTQR